MRKTTVITIFRATNSTFVKDSTKDARLRLAILDKTDFTAAFRTVFIDTLFKRLDS